MSAVPGHAAIRKAIPADVPAIISLERAVAGAAHWAEGEYWKIFDISGMRRIALLAESPTIAGFLVARVAGEEWEIENIAVREAARRKGAARALLTSLLHMAAEAAATSVTLEVRETNMPARALYASCGFAELARRRGYYSDPVENAIIYRIRLPQELPKPVEGA